ncbi:hypothetical protein TNCV_197631 [Trichonephila clavipes]|uniref:Uncharacterized protein n=1 Tax=Trichonephila clavipes TaxID=2585209 RepID=A0A8X6RBD4_TRICX|nr:hypothetical protein TNCV_197631 [Trichonephila clavipes]
MDSGEFLKFATQNKSKKSPFAFKELLKDLNADEIDKMWEELSKTVFERMEIIIGSSVKGSPNKKESTTKKIFKAHFNGLSCIMPLLPPTMEKDETLWKNV